MEEKSPLVLSRNILTIKQDKKVFIFEVLFMIQTNFLLPLTLSSKMAGRLCFNGSRTIYILVSLFVAQFLKDPTKLLCKNANKFKPRLTTQTSQRFLNFIRSQDLITSTLFKIELIEDTASFLPNLTIREII
jgi:hypothetical protein